ncbi:phosphotransferase [Sphaerisporangium sp. TRM90804]|uniref:phosphotransferase n=1 Tax=Sphaerisporangium sp. TRM90804 TaxID=3031113 RepID=UPI00244943D1|nr:phosphotransferase [Sphaerisporangium sp. TRM90804]MDH2428937.1 phosphotransferase [Sphaerisporangium sp. TRM90804]
MAGRYLAYPPGRGNVLIPAGDRRSAAAGLSLVTLSKPLPLAAQLVLHAATRALGPRVLPGRRREWRPPVEEGAWAAISARVAALTGPFDGTAGYLRPQASRAGGAALLLLRAGRPIGFLKVRESPAELEREAAALAAFEPGDDVGFRVPGVLGSGSVGQLWWLLLSPMEPVPARPVREVAVERLAANIGSRLARRLARPPGVPEHWQPMHGDLTPWNLRHTRGRVPWLIDWEDAGYAPPHADEVYYLATRLAVYGGRPPARAYGEAAGYWHERVSRRASEDRELTRRLLAALAALEG